ncbi:dCTP deaminase [Streptomyces sp. TLI_171]|uniref:dCTP deaminase n=1 Tax=Streptomyces sp. TLI_171 TaxID=1938859 RepID=UPI000C191B6F|nr:dCTP deaminase [Streptomyces sp. TLI_171]RKE21960.1 dCTP deaminase [Streptomyces sp. TLI_171]
MILTGAQIAQEVTAGRIRITPFDPARCTTNSYDLTLGRRLARYRPGQVLDPLHEPEVEYFEIPADGYPMEPGEFVLGETAEQLGSDTFVPLIHAKSGFARCGAFAHVTADLIDLGFFGHSTLQLYATLPVVLVAGMPLAQVTFWTTYGEIADLYAGKYQGGDGPLPSRSHLDAWAVGARG